MRKIQNVEAVDSRHDLQIPFQGVRSNKKRRLAQDRRNSILPRKLLYLKPSRFLLLSGLPASASIALGRESILKRTIPHAAKRSVPRNTARPAAHNTAA